MRAFPKLRWGLTAVLLTVFVVVVIRRYVDLGLLWAYLVAINLVSFSLYGYDKRASKREGAGRVPNMILFGLAPVGGSAGALAGLRWWGHKTRREYFWWRAVVWLSLVAHFVLIYCGSVDESAVCRMAWDWLVEKIRALLAGA
jgi:uncharacterized membrane protein YsdA (DUF1294 family)